MIPSPEGGQVVFGEMVEWSITPVLKTGVPRGTGGSNPSLSAKGFEKLADLSGFLSFLQKLQPLLIQRSETTRVRLLTYNLFFSAMRKLFLVIQFAICVAAALPAAAQVHAHMKLWDRKYRYPKVNSVEFRGDVPSLSMYDAIYGHGAMWENEWIGFRVYMDHRQSIDLYGKKAAQLELDSTNFYSSRELMSEGFGEDILFVGGSIGAGSFRGYETGVPTFVDPVRTRGQRVLSEGPDTAIVEVYACDWQYREHTIQFRQRFTALRGRRDVQVDVWLEGCPDTEVFCTGVQKLESEGEGYTDPRGLVASWGTNIPDKGNADLVERLGIGVCVDRRNVVGIREDELNYLCLVRPVGGHIRYYIAAASDMQQEGGFHSSCDWFQWVANYDWGAAPKE